MKTMTHTPAERKAWKARNKFRNEYSSSRRIDGLLGAYKYEVASTDGPVVLQVKKRFRAIA